MYISARFAAPSRNFRFNLRRPSQVPPPPRNLEIAGDKRDSRRKKNNELVLPIVSTIAPSDSREITNHVKSEKDWRGSGGE